MGVLHWGGLSRAVPGCYVGTSPVRGSWHRDSYTLYAVGVDPYSGSCTLDFLTQPLRGKVVEAK